MGTENMSVNMELPTVSAIASVMVYDDVNKRWIPKGTGSGPHTAKVQIFQHSVNGTSRVVGRRISDQEVVINCPIVKGFKYNISQTPTFHQWRDNRTVYGLNFASQVDADTFAAAMYKAIDLLSNPQAPVSRSSAGTTNVYQTNYSQLPHQNSQPNFSNGFSSAYSNADDHDQFYGRTNYSTTEDHYSSIGKENNPKADWNSTGTSSGPTYLTLSNDSSNGPSNNCATQALISSLPTVQLQQQQQRNSSSSNSSPPYQQQNSQPFSNGLQSKVPQQEISAAAVLLEPQVVRQAAPPAPPPPPPPTVPGATGGTTGLNPLASALQNATLKRATRDNVSVSSTGGSGSVGTAVSQNGLISEMQATLARRRAKQDRGGIEDLGFGDNTGASPIKSSILSTEKKGWDNNNSRSASTSKLPVNGIGPESPKLPRKSSLFSALNEQEGVKTSNSETDSNGTTSDYDKLKFEVCEMRRDVGEVRRDIAEMRREINKMKTDLIDVIHQEFASRR